MQGLAGSLLGASGVMGTVKIACVSQKRKARPSEDERANVQG